MTASPEPASPAETGAPVDVDRLLGRQGLQPKGIARRREILDRAIDVFRERGADGTSLRRIAEALGVSHAALLHYFDSREQLLVAVYAHAEEQRSAADPTPRTGVDGMVHAAMANVEVPGLVKLYSTLVAASLESDSEVGTAFFSERFERIRTRLTAEFAADQEAGLIRDDVPAAHLAALLIAASDGLQIQWLLEPSLELQQTLRTFAALLQPPH